MADNLIGQSDDPNQAGVLGEGVTVEAGTGVYGRDRAGKGNGVIGYSEHGRGVWGHTQDGFGLLGESVNGRGVVGSSETAYGVYAHSKKSAGIRGDSDEGRGVEGWAINSEGVVGISTNGNGVWGQTEGAGVGVLGTSANNDGVRGVSTNQNGVSAFGGHTGIYAKAPVNAGFFEGNIHVTGDITTAGDVKLFGADCAEDFDIAILEQVEPGTVMAIDSEGKLRPTDQAYDKRVAGVISGAGDYKPGIVLDKRQTQGNRQPIALMGKVFCKVDARYGAIEVGDLLTTSSTLGHAMKTGDPLKAFGAVIGKALRPLTEGQGLIPILIALQ
jgi:hypothetical protein